MVFLLLGRVRLEKLVDSTIFYDSARRFYRLSSAVILSIKDHAHAWGKRRIVRSYELGPILTTMFLSVEKKKKLDSSDSLDKYLR